MVTVQAPRRFRFHKIKFTLHLTLQPLFSWRFVIWGSLVLLLTKEELNSVVVILGILIVRPEVS